MIDLRIIPVINNSLYFLEKFRNLPKSGEVLKIIFYIFPIQFYAKLHIHEVSVSDTNVQYCIYLLQLKFNNSKTKTDYS